MVNGFKSRRSLRNKSTVLFTAAGLVLSLAALFVLILYYGKLVNFSPAAAVSREYDKYYVMITENMDSEFWQNVYASAKTAAAGEDAYVEMLGENLSTDYSAEDLMRMAIASDVDGIIVEPNGDEELVSLINEAADKGIPVVTVSQDETQSERVSFVGVNSYSLSQKYASEVIKAVGKDTRSILVLMNTQDSEAEENTVFNAIKEWAEKSDLSTFDIEVTAVNMNSSKDFDSEEKIRELLLNAATLPDILVCLDATDTECAYQAVREYNLVGDITIIGYYSTDTILTAVKKNIIESTFAVDAAQMGQYSVDALVEYARMGHVNDYFSVDVTLVNSDNVDSFLTPEETAEES